MLNRKKTTVTIAQQRVERRQTNKREIKTRIHHTHKTDTKKKRKKDQYKTVGIQALVTFQPVLFMRKDKMLKVPNVLSTPYDRYFCKPF